MAIILMLLETWAFIVFFYISEPFSADCTDGLGLEG
jgi:hypothetical protein